MKMHGSSISGYLRTSALVVAGLVVAAGQAVAANYEWTFNSGNLSAGLGNGTMAYTDAETTGLTTFGVTGGGVPDINGQAASYIHVPVMPNIGNGYHLTFNDTAPNGGGSYVNQYTIIFDVLHPTAITDYGAFFNTNPGNPSGNDADFYLASDGSIGITAVYSSAGVIAANTWYRIAFVADLASSTMSYYVNGSQVASGSQGGSGVDGRWSLLSNLDLGVDLLLFNEGDTSGNYTDEWLVNSIAFTDHAMNSSEVGALGGPNAQGILVPEPGTMTLLMLGIGAVVWRFRRENQ